LLQQTEYDVTNVEVSLEGLDGKMSGYHIHMVIFINTYKDFMSYIYKIKKEHQMYRIFLQHFLGHFTFTCHFHYNNIIVNNNK